jgi:YD repeat-containing protein
VVFQRTFYNALSKEGYGSPGLARGWTHNFDTYISGAGNDTEAPFLLHHPNGGAEVIMANHWSSMGEMRMPDGASQRTRMEMDPATNTPMFYISEDHATMSYRALNSPFFECTYVPYRLSIPNGHYIEFHWNEFRALTSITDDQTPSRELLHCTYAPRLSSITDCYAREVKFYFCPPTTTTDYRLIWASCLMPAGTTQPVKHRWEYQYLQPSTAPLLSAHSMIDPSDPTRMSTLTFAYDSQERVSSQTDSRGVKFQYTYDTDNFRTRVDTFDAANNLVDSYWQHYDEMERDTGTSDMAGRRSFIEYGDLINVSSPTKIVDKDGRVTTFTYDYFGHVLTVMK